MSVSSEVWSKSKDVLTVLVVPALIWVFSVSNTIEAQKVLLNSLEGKVSEHKTSLERLEASERTFSVQLARLETQLDGITRKTDENHSMLLRLVNNGGLTNP
jgi:hypothetical protein